jgi:putative ABC transport system permease protein
LYGVLDYSVLQRRRELGIRIAIGAPAADIVRRVTVGVFGMVLLGSAVGAGAGLLLEPYVKSLLYQAKPSDLGALILPLTIIIVATLLAALPAAIRAIRIDASAMLRAE